MAGGRQPGYDNDEDDFGYENRNDLLDIIPERFSDEPVAEEEPQKGRALLMGAALVGIAVAGAAAWYLFSGSPSPEAQMGGVPTISADGAYKTKPDDPGGMQVPNQDKQVYQRLNPDDPAAQAQITGQPQPERVIAMPEQPKAPPAVPPTPVVSAETAPPPAPALTSRPPSVLSTPAPAAPSAQVTAPSVPVATTPPTALSSAAPAPAPVVAPKVVAPAPVATPAPVVAKAAPAPAAVPAAGGTGPFTIQIAALRDEASARKTWQGLQQKYPALLGSLSLVIEKSDQGAKGVFYRVRGTGLPSEERARYVCSELSKDKVGCLFVGK